MAAPAAATCALTAIVDADIGQSRAGPPGAVGLAYFERGTPLLPPPWTAAALHYVGSIAPAGHLLPLVIGTARLVERARAAGAAPILVDTTGPVQGGTGPAHRR